MGFLITTERSSDRLEEGQNLNTLLHRAVLGIEPRTS